MSGRALLLALMGALVALGALRLTFAEPQRSAGVVEGRARSAAGVAAGAAAQEAARSAVGSLATADSAPHARAPRRILFGDLHVHSTFSIDAFVYSLPLFAGEGAHPPADACDFARHCAQLDFFSINDHAEGLTPERWEETKESIRECNALAGDPADPDLVAYVGWEWTQAGPTPETHYGHRNVIFPGLGDDELPARPITALPDGTMERARALGLVRALGHLGPLGLGPYADFFWWIGQLPRTPDCERGVDTRRLPADCRENAVTPAELLEKLAQWDLDALVIPHGLAWGVHAPPGSRADLSLRAGNHDPALERLIETFSGHGNSEEYREFPEPGSGAEAVCPPPSREYLPCCWRAGEIMRSRCGDLPVGECEARVEEARRLALEAGIEPHRVFPDTRPEDWLDCDQCRDCFKPAMNLRPGLTTQYAAALSDFDRVGPDGRPGRFRWGFIASTDNHAARPGTGYKQYERLIMTDARGIASPRTDRLTRRFIVGRQKDPRRAQAVAREPRGLRGLVDVERGASFLYPGGIVAVHADGRDRDAIWDALRRREVYGTSGPRILLWFDLINGPGGAAPMGSEVELAGIPRFEVRAVGSLVQKPGCSAESHGSLSPERLERLCRGECYHPGDERHPLAAIEVARIRPQRSPDEPIADLIEDPWRRFECPPDPAGCVARFEDPEHPSAARDAVYYARALQVETPAINAATVRAEFDAAGNAVGASPCHGGYRTPADDDCLAPARERAWSSPIYVDFPRAGAVP